MNTKTSSFDIYLSPPHMEGQEFLYLKDAFESGWISSVGPYIERIEKIFQEYTGAEAACAVSSGTAAIHLGLHIVGINPGDVVLAPSFTFIATVSPALQLGATVEFVDSEEDTWNIDPELLEGRIVELKKQGKTVKAVLPVHLYGIPCNEKVFKICSSARVAVVEDAAEALGTRIGDHHCGRGGRFGVFSFNGNKIITTSGGGMLVGESSDIAKAKYLSTQARDPAIHYQHSTVGYNYRMSNLLAAVGCGQMEVLENKVLKKESINRWYREGLTDVPGVTFINPPTLSRPNWWLTTILIDEKVAGFTKDHVMNVLSSNRIESRPLWKPLHMQPVFKDIHMSRGHVCEKLFDQGLCLPSGTALEYQDVSRICSLIRGLSE